MCCVQGSDGHREVHGVLQQGLPRVRAQGVLGNRRVLLVLPPSPLPQVSVLGLVLQRLFCVNRHSRVILLFSHTSGVVLSTLRHGASPLV